MKLHYPEGMATHGVNACKYHGFEKYDWKTDRNEPALFWLYFEDDYKYLSAHQGRRYVFWNGSDVLRLANQLAGKVINIVRDPQIVHACQNKLLQEELAIMGIHATVSPLFYGDRTKYSVSHNQTRDCFMMANKGRGIEYGESVFNALAWRFPDWNFHVFGIDPTIPVYCENVKYYGWIPEDEMDAMTKDFGIFFRYNSHDGFSQTAMKALFRGQRVITRIDFGGLTNYCKTFEDMCNVIATWETPVHFNKIPDFNDFSFLKK